MISYKLSSELDGLLKSLLGKTPHHTENSQCLVKEMLEVKLKKVQYEDCLVTEMLEVKLKNVHYGRLFG